MPKRPRCTKRDQDDGSGCVAAAGHMGRCTIRPDAAEAFATGKIPPRAAGRRSPAKPRNLTARFAELSDLAARIETETEALMADCRRAIEAIGAVAEAVNQKNRALLKSLLKSRREVQRLAEIDGEPPTDIDEEPPAETVGEKNRNLLKSLK